MKPASRAGSVQDSGCRKLPGPKSVNKAHAKSRVRPCFANLSHDEINQGVATLAGIWRREFGMQ
jgi:DNA-binding transcriptional MocR family regulator